MNKLFFVVFTIFFACNSTSNSSKEETFLEKLDSLKIEQPAISKDISDVIQSIPSPLEISVLLKASDTKYDASMLNSPDNISKYNSNYSKALNLGIFGTDLGYTNIYKQSQDGLSYMASVKKLADGLNIGQFFSIEIIKRLAVNSNNLDSLLLITTQNFNKINSYLQEQNRADLSVLLLTGGWLETMYITCQISAKNPTNEEIQEKVGEQKIVLEKIILLVSFYSQTNSNMKQLMEDLLELQAAFDTIKIVTTYKKSSAKVMNGVMVIKDNNQSHVTITSEDIEKIKTLTENIRKKIIS